MNKRIRSKIISVWFTPSDYEAIQRLAMAEDNTVSQVVRTAMRRLLLSAGLVQVDANTKNA